MNPNYKGPLAISLLVAAHMGLAFGGYALVSSLPTPAPVAAEPTVAAPETAAIATPQSKPAPTPKPVAEIPAPEQRRQAMAFLTEISKGDYVAARAMMTDEARRTNGAKKFKRTVEPLTWAQLRQVSWQKIKTHVQQDDDLPASTPPPVIATDLNGTMVTADSNVKIELGLVAVGGEWKISRFSFDGPLPDRAPDLRTASK
ncbi:MAG: hypothetical protein ACT4N2_05880 [Hyphomicrobium sp.]